MSMSDAGNVATRIEGGESYAPQPSAEAPLSSTDESLHKDPPLQPSCQAPVFRPPPDLVPKPNHSPPDRPQTAVPMPAEPPEAAKPPAAPAAATKKAGVSPDKRDMGGVCEEVVCAHGCIGRWSAKWACEGGYAGQAEHPRSAHSLIAQFDAAYRKNPFPSDEKGRDTWFKTQSFFKTIGKRTQREFLDDLTLTLDCRRLIRCAADVRNRLAPTHAADKAMDRMDEDTGDDPASQLRSVSRALQERTKEIAAVRLSIDQKRHLRRLIRKEREELASKRVPAMHLKSREIERCRRDLDMAIGGKDEALQELTLMIRNEKARLTELESSQKDQEDKYKGANKSRMAKPTAPMFQEWLSASRRSPHRPSPDGGSPAKMPRQADKSGTSPPRPSAPSAPAPPHSALGPLPTVERGGGATHELKDHPIPPVMGGEAEAKDMDAKAPSQPSPTVPDGLSESRHASFSNQSAANGEPDPTNAFPLTLRLRALIPDRQPLGVCPWRPTRRDPWAKVRVCFNKVQTEYVNIKDFHLSQFPMREAYREAIKIRNNIAARLGLAPIPVDQADHVLDTEDWSKYETLDTAPKRRKRRQSKEPSAPVPPPHSGRKKVPFIEQLRSLLPPEAPLGLSVVANSSRGAPPTAIEKIMVGFRQQEGQPREEVVCADFPSLREAVECAVEKRNAKAAEWSLHPLSKDQVDTILTQVDWAKWEGVGGGAGGEADDVDMGDVVDNTVAQEGMKRTVKPEPSDAPHHHPQQHGEQSDGSECEDEEQPLQMRLHRANLDLMKQMRKRVTDRVRALTPADKDPVYLGIYMSNKKAAFFASVKEEPVPYAQQKKGPARRVAELGLRGAFAMAASDRDRLADAVGIPRLPDPATYADILEEFDSGKDSDGRAEPKQPSQPPPPVRGRSRGRGRVGRPPKIRRVPPLGFDPDRVIKQENGEGVVMRGRARGRVGRPPTRSRGGRGGGVSTRGRARRYRDSESDEDGEGSVDDADSLYGAPARRQRDGRTSAEMKAEMAKRLLAGDTEDMDMDQYTGGGRKRRRKTKRHESPMDVDFSASVEKKGSMSPSRTDERIRAARMAAEMPLPTTSLSLVSPSLSSKDYQAFLSFMQQREQQQQQMAAGASTELGGPSQNDPFALPGCSREDGRVGVSSAAGDGGSRGAREEPPGFKSVFVLPLCPADVGKPQFDGRPPLVPASHVPSGGSSMVESPSGRQSWLVPLKPPTTNPIVEGRRPEPAASASGVALSAQLALTDGMAGVSADAEMGKEVCQLKGDWTEYIGAMKASQRPDLLAVVPFFEHGEGQGLPPSEVLATLRDDRTVLCDAMGVAHPSTLLDLLAFLTAGGDVGKMDTGMAADGEFAALTQMDAMWLSRALKDHNEQSDALKIAIEQLADTITKLEISGSTLLRLFKYRSSGSSPPQPSVEEQVVREMGVELPLRVYIKVRHILKNALRDIGAVATAD